MCFKINFFKSCLSQKDEKSGSHNNITEPCHNSLPDILAKSEIQNIDTPKIEQNYNDNESLKYLSTFFNNFQTKLNNKVSLINTQYENDSKKIDQYLMCKL